MSREQLVAIVEGWRVRLCPEWQVLVSFDEPDDPPHVDDGDDWVACVEPRPMVGETTIYFRPAVLEKDEGDVARIVVHELLHPLLDRVLDHDAALKPYCGEVQWEVYREVQRVTMEEFVNRMAHAIVNGRARTGTHEAAARGA